MGNIPRKEPHKAECYYCRSRHKCSDESTNSAKPTRSAHASKTCQSRSPVNREDYRQHVNFIVRKRRINHVSKRCTCKGKHRWIPNHVLNPLEPNRQESPSSPESFLNPQVDTALFGPSSSKFSRHKRCGYKKNERSRNKEKDKRKTFFCHHW
ncbi:hypothetical protein ES703_125103 [subsurface metagenome]